MSDQLTDQSRSNESGITRRTALRGAAWSASAVTVVVATPNIAAATVTGTASGSMARVEKTASGTATLTNGSAAIAASTLEVVIVGGSLATAPLGWQRINGTVFRYTGGVAAGGSAAFQVTTGSPISLSDNGQAHTMSLTFRVGSLTLDSLTYYFTSKNQTVAGV